MLSWPSGFPVSMLCQPFVRWQERTWQRWPMPWGRTHESETSSWRLAWVSTITLTIHMCRVLYTDRKQVPEGQWRWVPLPEPYMCLEYCHHKHVLMCSKKCIMWEYRYLIYNKVNPHVFFHILLLHFPYQQLYLVSYVSSFNVFKSNVMSKVI